MKSRRSFLMTSPMAVMAATVLQPSLAADGTAATPGAPPTFGTMPAVGPEVSASTFAEAEKLVQVTMSESQRDMAALSWRTSMPAMLERRTGPRKVAPAANLPPANGTPHCRGPSRGHCGTALSAARRSRYPYRRMMPTSRLPQSASCPAGLRPDC